MSTTKIQWADKVWNPVTGCTPISEGCANCYAKRMSVRLAGRYGYPGKHIEVEWDTLDHKQVTHEVKDDPFRVTFHHDKLDEPLRWRKPQKVFVCSMSDLFHEEVSTELREKVFLTMAKCPQHTFMILTKRPQIMSVQVNAFFKNFIQTHTNIWLGVTAENQRTADERIPILLQIPAAKHFVSVEPMLGPVHLFLERNALDWVIAGPETGPRARPTSIDWVRDLQRQCAGAGVPFFDKKDVLGETIQEWPR